MAVVAIFLVAKAASRRERIFRTATSANLRELRAAIESYAADHGEFPAMSWGDLRADQSVFGPGSPAGGLRLYATLHCARRAQGGQSASDLDASAARLAKLASQRYDPYPVGDDWTRWHTASRLGGNFVYWNLAQYRSMLAAGQIARTGTRFPYAPSEERLAAFEEAFGEWVLWSVGPLGWKEALDGERPIFLPYDPTNGATSAGSMFVAQKLPEPGWVDAQALQP